MVNKFADRLTTFLRLAHQFPSARLAHAGAGDKHSGISQSDVARQIILGSGIDAERIIFTDRSSNTCQDASMSFEDIKPDSREVWLLVTSAFHMPRAMACFRTLNWRVVAYPTDYMYEYRLQGTSLPKSLEDIDLAVHEWLGLLYYRITGLTLEIYPAANQSGRPG